MEKLSIVNQAVLDELGLETIEGADLSDYFSDNKIIGVVNDFHFTSYHNKVDPLHIRFVKPEDASCLNIKLSPGKFLEQKKQMEDIWKTFSPEYPLELQFIDDQIASMYEREERLSKAITTLSIIAFLLVTLGILGQAFQIALNKTKEIGIRKVNGASLYNIYKVINNRFIVWLVIAFLLAVPLTYYILQKWLENFAYKTPLNWWIFALAGLCTLIFVIGVVTLQSWKTATRNPVEALRHE